MHREIGQNLDALPAGSGKNGLVEGVGVLESGIIRDQQPARPDYRLQMAQCGTVVLLFNIHEDKIIRAGKLWERFKNIGLGNGNGL